MVDNAVKSYSDIHSGLNECGALLIENINVPVRVCETQIKDLPLKIICIDMQSPKGSFTAKILMCQLHA